MVDEIKTTTTDGPAQAELVERAERIHSRPGEQSLHRDAQRELDKIPARIESIKAASKFMHIADQLEARFKGLYSWRNLDTGSWLVWVAFQFGAIGEAAEVLRFLAREYDLHLTRKVAVDKGTSSLDWFLPGLRIIGYFQKPNAQCRFVQTGTRTEIVPVFEMQCEAAGEPISQDVLKVTQGPVSELEGLPF